MKTADIGRDFTNLEFSLLLHIYVKESHSLVMVTYEKNNDQWTIVLGFNFIAWDVLSFVENCISSAMWKIPRLLSWKLPTRLVLKIPLLTVLKPAGRVSSSLLQFEVQSYQDTSLLPCSNLAVFWEYPATVRKWAVLIVCGAVGTLESFFLTS